MLSKSDAAAPTRKARFHARWATGFYHHRPWFSANRCLDVQLTTEALHTRLMFPFSLLSSTQWDFHNTILLDRIKAVRKARFLNWWPTVEINYVDNAGCSRCLEICFTGPLPQIGASQQEKQDAFIQAIQEAKRASE